MFAAFVAQNPIRHARLILNAYQWAAVVAAIAGIAGYFDIVSGAGELFTKFGRAAGTFKDPNVYGPFLVPALLLTLPAAFDPAGEVSGSTNSDGFAPGHGTASQLFERRVG